LKALQLGSSRQARKPAPEGCGKPAEARFCLLDTSYSKIQTKNKKIRFIPVENADRSLKKRNRLCYDYYKNDFLPKLGKNVLNELYCKYNDFGKTIDFDMSEYPIELYEHYDKRIEKMTNDSLLFYSEKVFLSWYRKVSRSSRYILVRNGDKKHLKKLICRFDDQYSEMIKNRMNWLMWEYGNENACSVTLTLNPSNFRNDKLCMWEVITILANEFLTRLRRWLKHKGLPCRYIRCIESMKGISKNDFVGRGNPHIHYCFFGLKYIPKDVIDSFWPYGFNFINSTAKNHKVRYPIHYITKYITKTYTENDPDNTLNQSLVWFFNKNSFDHSSKLVYPLYKPGSGLWVCDFVIEMDPLENQIVEMKEIFKAVESLYKTPPPMVI